MQQTVFPLSFRRPSDCPCPRLVGLFLVLAASFASGADSPQEIWESMRMGRWHEAGTALKRMTGSAAQEDLARIRFTEGSLWQFRRPGADPEKARRIFQSILDDFPHSPQAPWALLAM